MPADARDAARRIVDEIFGGGGSDQASVTPEPEPNGAAVPAAPVATSITAAQRRARELVAEVFDPPPPSTVAPPPPTAAELAGRRIVAEADAAQRARAEERAAERAAAVRAERAAHEAEQRGRALRARQDWMMRARAEQDTADERERALALAQEERERSERQRQEAEAARAEVIPAPTPDGAPTPDDEALFPEEAVSEAASDAGDGLFDREPRDLPPSLAEDVDGPPTPPLTSTPLRLAEAPPAPQLAAQLVSEVLEERSVAAPDGPGDTERTADDQPEEDRPRRAARWLIVTIVGAVTLALLFPLAVRAVLQLVTLS